MSEQTSKAAGGTSGQGGQKSSPTESEAAE